MADWNSEYENLYTGHPSSALICVESKIFIWIYTVIINLSKEYLTFISISSESGLKGGNNYMDESMA
ncbi:hypothetical protein ES705_39591 [subsurface metagenome]